MNEGLLRMCRDALIPEPIIITQGKDGVHRFATEALPLRSLIDVRLGTICGGLKAEGDTVTITLDGRTAVYKRRGFDIHGRWICDLENQ